MYVCIPPDSQPGGPGSRLPPGSSQAPSSSQAPGSRFQPDSSQGPARVQPGSRLLPCSKLLLPYHSIPVAIPSLPHLPMGVSPDLSARLQASQALSQAPARLQAPDSRLSARLQAPGFRLQPGSRLQPPARLQAPETSLQPSLEVFCVQSRSFKVF